MADFLEPTWPTQAQRQYELESFYCREAQMPLYLTGITLQVIRGLFSDASNISNPSLKNMLAGTGSNCNLAQGPYNPNGAGGIYIGSGLGGDSTQTAKRPAITVMAGEFGTAVLGMNDRVHQNLSSKPLVGEAYARRINGGTQIYCKAVEPEVAVAIANETFFYLLRYGPLVEKDFKITSWKPSKCSAVQQVAGATTPVYMCTIDISWTIDYAWTLKLDAPMIKRMIVEPKEHQR